MNKFAIGCGGLLVIILFIVFVIGLFFWGTYNRLVTLDQNVNKKWGDVQTVYQRRADLIPNLVNTVQGAANFEKSTIVEVTNARASVGRVQLDPSKAPTDAKQLEEFQAAQGQLSNALSRLLVVVERYPELKSNQNFLGLQAQLEGTENRISVERNNFNGAVQDFNTAVRRFPTNMIAGMFGFSPRPFFAAQPGAEKAPTVNFNFGSPAPADDVRYGAEGALLLASSEGLLDPPSSRRITFRFGGDVELCRGSHSAETSGLLQRLRRRRSKRSRASFQRTARPIRARDLEPSRGRGVPQNAKRLGDCRLHPAGRPSVGCWAKRRA